MTELSTGMTVRRLSQQLDSLVLVEPVVALHGPRSVGKSTVLLDFARRRGSQVIDLDDPATRDAVLANVTLALSAESPVCLDEYQHVPEVLDALKARLNREGALPGTAVLTGSTRQDALPRTAQALTGRLHPMKIWPLSQGEIEGVTENLLVSLRDDPVHALAAHPTSQTSRADYVDRVCSGGFPLALRRARGAARNRWFDDYVTQSVERDAIELSRIRERQLLGQLLARLAGQTGQLLNLTKVGNGLATTRNTLESHTRLLEDLFLLERLPAWGKTLKARSVAAPKLHVIDSGVAARLMRVSPQKLAGLDQTSLTEFGNLLETFVVGELRKQVSWLDEPVTVGHWRTHDDDEVDYVVEFDDGRVVAFEVKANERVSAKDRKGMRKLRDLLGDRFIAGVVFSTGARSFTSDDERIHIMPVDRLWRPVP
jgi:predicted AAA+ superfamily ATPase